MKPASLIPPAVALFLAGSWVVPQRILMAGLENDCVRLCNTLIAASSPSSTESPSRDPLEKRRRIIEWTELAAHFPSNPAMSSGTFSNTLPDPRVAMRFRQRMDAMSNDEMIAALDEIAALDLPPESRDNLNWTLLDALARRDPDIALKLMEDRAMTESPLFRELISGALAAWAKIDAGAAGAWLDQQIAAGISGSKALNGVNDSRQKFEASLIAILLTSAPEAAVRRIAALPEDQRGDVLHMYSLSTVPEANQVAHARLVRAQVPAEDQAAIIASQASMLFKPGDYSAVTAYLERIDATPSERAACAMRATQNMNPRIPTSNHLTRDDIDGLREWVGSQAPDSMDTITGKALGEAAQGNRKMEFTAAAGLAEEYSATSGNDEVLATFLESWAARSNKAVARALAAKISDEARRAKILTHLE